MHLAPRVLKRPVPHGRLVTAGLDLFDPGCSDLKRTTTFSLEVLASCTLPFTVLAVDTASVHIEAFATEPANKLFSNITMAL